MLRIVDLTPAAEDWIEQAAALLLDAFGDRTSDWKDLKSTRSEVRVSLEPEKISRVALDSSDRVIGWIGGLPMYGGHVWELHPLVVASAHRRQGVGRALVADLEALIAERGALTLWLGSDDENDETTLSDVDLYRDVPAAIRDLRVRRGVHPHEFYRRLGFCVTGVLPDANGRGKPDIFYSKRIIRRELPPTVPAS